MTENEAIEAIQFDLEIGGEIHSQVLRDDDYEYCPHCGQHIDWRNE